MKFFAGDPGKWEKVGGSGRNELSGRAKTDELAREPWDEDILSPVLTFGAAREERSLPSNVNI